MLLMLSPWNANLAFIVDVPAYQKRNFHFVDDSFHRLDDLDPKQDA